MEIAHLKAKHTGLMAQGCSKPALACTSRACDDDRDATLNVAAGGQFHNTILVQSAAYIKLSFHDGSLIAESGALEQTLIPVFIPLLVFCLQKKQQSVAQGHAVDTSGLNKRPPALFHAGESQLLDCC